MAVNLISGTQRLFHTWTKGERRNTAEIMKIGGLVSIEHLEDQSAIFDDHRGGAKKHQKKHIRKSLTIDLRPATAVVSSPPLSPVKSLAPVASKSPVTALFKMPIYPLDMPESPPMPSHPHFQKANQGSPQSPEDRNQFESLEERRKTKPLPGRPRSYSEPASPTFDIDMAPVLGLAELPGSLPHGMSDEDAKKYAHSSKIPVIELERQRTIKRQEQFGTALVGQWYHKQSKSEANLADRKVSYSTKTRKDSKTGIERLVGVTNSDLAPAPLEVKPLKLKSFIPEESIVISPLSPVQSPSSLSQESQDMKNYVKMNNLLLAEVDRLKAQLEESKASATKQVQLVKKQLEDSEKRAARASVLRIENDYLEHSVKEKQSAIETTLTHLSQSQSEERTIKNQKQMLENQVLRLEGRLDESNAQRVDLEEALLEMKSRDIAAGEMEELSQQLSTAKQRVEELEAEAASRASEKEAFTKFQEEFVSLQKEMEETKKSLRKASTERDRVASLLQAEIRRQAMAPIRDSIDTVDTTSSTIDKAIAEIHARVRNALASGVPYEPASNPIERIAQLEREVEYHVKDIILYKLDVKGYRKDIKKLQAEMKQLQALQRSVPPSPASSLQTQSSSVHGLGIGQTPNPTPPSTILTLPSPISSPSSLSEDRVLRQWLSSNPTHRPKTPLTSHKKLPKPPTTPPAKDSVPSTVQVVKTAWIPDPPLSSIRSKTPQPPQMRKLTKRPSDASLPRSIQRGGTERSTSESIISSYYFRPSPDPTSARIPGGLGGFKNATPRMDVLQKAEMENAIRKATREELVR